MKLLKNHTIILLYHFVFIVLLYGVIQTSGFIYTKKLTIFYFSFLITYLLSYYLILKNKFEIDFKFIKLNLNKWIIILPITSVILIILHLLYLGEFHALSALKLSDINEVVHLRRSITSDSNYLINYIASFNIKGLLPLQF